jgi:RND family efflux transporter MFP subunit
MLASDSVSRQDAEEKIGDAKAKQAALASAEANVRRLAELQSFERVVAPFGGVVTQRNVDVGALVDAGGTAAQPLFRVADTHRLRVYVQVPEIDAAEIRVNTEARLHVAERPQQVFQARVIATASALDPSTRTLLTLLEVVNAKGELLPGGYAEVHFALPPRAGAFRLPANTLLFRANGMNVAVVDAHQRLLIKPITLGRDFGKEVEVISGLSAADRVVLNPPDSAQTGDEVRITKETSGR